MVNSDPTSSRVSIPFFYECTFDTEVAPIPQLIDGGIGNRHKPIKYGTHLLSKVLNNFEFEEGKAAIAV